MLRFIKEKARIPKLRFKVGKGPFTRKRLDEIASKKISYGIVQAGDHVPDGMPYIKSMDLNGLLKLEKLDRTSSEIAKKYRRSEVGPGDIVFSLRGNIGVVQIVPESIAVSNLTQGTARIAVGNDYNKYICCTLQSSDVARQVQAYAKGSTFREISLEDLRKVTIAVPILPEQQKIADFLTAVDGRIGQLIQKKALLEDYKKGVMQQLFTQTIRFKDDQGNDFPSWEKKKLGEVYKLQGGFAFKSSEFQKSGIPIVRISNVTDRGVNLKEVVHHRKIENDDNFLINTGDLLIALSGATTGKTCIYQLDDMAYLNQRVGVFRQLIESYNYDFLVQLVVSPIFRNKLGSVLVAGAQPNVSPKEIEGFMFLFPSHIEQTKIANFLSAIDRKIESVATQITETQTFKRGLLQQMFV